MRASISKRTGVTLLLAAAGASLVVGIADLRTSQRILADGVTTRARVTGKHTERHRSWTHRYVDLEFGTAAGGVVSARDRVTSALYERVKAGDTMTVRYLPSDPDKHLLGAATGRDTFMLWMAGLWLILGGVYLLFGT